VKFFKDIIQISGAPRAKPVAPDQRPSGATSPAELGTSRPKVGVFIHGQRPWLSAAGVNYWFSQYDLKRFDRRAITSSSGLMRKLNYFDAV